MPKYLVGNSVQKLNYIYEDIITNNQSPLLLIIYKKSAISTKLHFSFYQPFLVDTLAFSSLLSKLEGFLFHLYGDSPIIFLKFLLKVDICKYPTFIAISSMEYIVDFISSQALFIRIRLKYSNGARPGSLTT